MKTTEKDILMICKGHYDHEKHVNLEEALDAYYRRHYDVSKEDLPRLSYKMMMTLWFNRCIRAFLSPEKISSFCYRIFEEETLYEKNYMGKNVFGKPPIADFYEILYHRVVVWLQLLSVKDKKGNWIIDLSDYDGNVI